MMTPVHPVHAAVIVVGVGLMLVAALHDVAARTVPNRLCAAVAVAGLGAQSVAGMPAGLVGWAVGIAVALSVGAAVFIVAALCWRRGWMGGGDVKLLGAAALLVSPVGVPTLLLSTALAGGVLALPYLAARRRLSPSAAIRPAGMLRRAVRAERWRLRRGGPMPYAVAIAAGAVFAVSNQLVSSSGASP